MYILPNKYNFIPLVLLNLYLTKCQILANGITGFNNMMTTPYIFNLSYTIKSQNGMGTLNGFQKVIQGEVCTLSNNFAIDGDTTSEKDHVIKQYESLPYPH